MLKEQVDRLTDRTTGRINDYLQYEVLKSELDSNMALYQGLTQKLQQAGITASLQATHVGVVNPPLVPYKIHSPPWKFVIPGLILFSLIMAVIGALVAERVDDSLTLPSQVEESVQLPVMGVIPHFKHSEFPKKPLWKRSRKSARLPDYPSDPSVVTAEYDSAAAEAYRALRTALLFPLSGAPKVVLVTSAVPTDGKTTTSINLATALAQQNHRVLLIDGDLHRPLLHSHYHKNDSDGLSSLLSNSSLSLDGHIARVGAGGLLSLLPSGATPPISGDLLESSAMADLLARLRKQFDYIIIDSPPALAINDALILARHADAVLLVVRARKTPLAALRYAVKKLANFGVPIKGVVFTDVDTKAPEYLYSEFSYSDTGRYYKT